MEKKKREKERGTRHFERESRPFLRPSSSLIIFFPLFISSQDWDMLSRCAQESFNKSTLLSRAQPTIYESCIENTFISFFKESPMIQSQVYFKCWSRGPLQGFSRVQIFAGRAVPLEKIKSVEDETHANKVTNDPSVAAMTTDVACISTPKPSGVNSILITGVVSQPIRGHIARRWCHRPVW